MSEKIRLAVTDRREFLLGAGAAAVLAITLPLTSSPASAAAWEDALKKLIGDAEPVEGKVSIDLPEIAENGNTVPFSVAVDSPMTSDDYVKAVHVMATENPNPDVASFSFSPQSGQAEARSRMRLAKTQDVVAVAEMSDGKIYMARRTVKVTIGGCGG